MSARRRENGHDLATAVEADRPNMQIIMMTGSMLPRRKSHLRGARISGAAQTVSPADVMNQIRSRLGIPHVRGR